MHLPIFSRKSPTSTEPSGIVSSDIIKAVLVAEEATEKPYKYVAAYKTTDGTLYIGRPELYDTIEQAYRQVTTLIATYNLEL